MTPPHSWLLLFPRRIEARLEELRSSGLFEPDEIPNLWQVQLGVARMWHRVLFRPETIGTCAAAPVRPTWRAKLLERRPLRFPFLLWEKAVHPLDFSGLASSPERIVAHLLGAHHDGVQFHYDFELLSTHPERLAEVRDQARAIVAGSHPRGEWLADLVVYEGYHQKLLEAVEKYLAGDLEVPAAMRDDPDIVLRAYLRWCARQPKTPRQTWEAWRRGEFTIADGWRPREIAARRPSHGSAVSVDG